MTDIAEWEPIKRFLQDQWQRLDLQARTLDAMSYEVPMLTGRVLRYAAQDTNRRVETEQWMFYEVIWPPFEGRVAHRGPWGAHAQAAREGLPRPGGIPGPRARNDRHEGAGR